MSSATPPNKWNSCSHFWTSKTSGGLLLVMGIVTTPTRDGLVQTTHKKNPLQTSLRSVEGDLVHRFHVFTTISMRAFTVSIPDIIPLDWWLFMLL